MHLSANRFPVVTETAIKYVSHLYEFFGAFSLSTEEENFQLPLSVLTWAFVWR